MSFIELDGINDVHEPVTAPEGMYDLVIASATIKEKEGKKNIFCVIEFENTDTEYANILHNVSLPSSDDDSDKRKNKLLFAKRFFHQFNIPFEGGVDVEAFSGSRARCKVSVGEYDNKPQNKISLDSLPEGA
jgi:hypothetical protein